MIQFLWSTSPFLLFPKLLHTLIVNLQFFLIWSRELHLLDIKIFGEGKFSSVSFKCSPIAKFTLFRIFLYSLCESKSMRIWREQYVNVPSISSILCTDLFFSFRCVSISSNLIELSTNFNMTQLCAGNIVSNIGVNLMLFILSR